MTKQNNRLIKENCERAGYDGKKKFLRRKKCWNITDFAHKRFANRLKFYIDASKTTRKYYLYHFRRTYISPLFTYILGKALLIFINT